MKTKIYRTARYALLAFAAAYVFLLSYPQVLFAHEVSYKNFTVYSREPLDQSVYSMLDKVEAQVSASPLNTPDVKPKIFLTGSHRLYSLLSLYVGGSATSIAPRSSQRS